MTQLISDLALCFCRLDDQIKFSRDHKLIVWKLVQYYNEHSMECMAAAIRLVSKCLPEYHTIEYDKLKRKLSVNTIIVRVIYKKMRAIWTNFLRTHTSIIRYRDSINIVINERAPKTTARLTENLMTSYVI